MENKIRRMLKKLTAQGKNKFVIYPYGKYGKIAKEILNKEFHIKEKYIVDHMLSKMNPEIKDLPFLKEDYKRDDFMVLVALDPVNWQTSLEVHQQIAFMSVERIADPLSGSMYFNPWGLYEPIRRVKRPKVALIECISREIYQNGIRGSVAEAGVFQGNTARFINYLFPDRPLYLFDTFEGFHPKDQEADDKRNLFNLKLDFSETSEGLVLDKMHFPQQCRIKKGWFPESAAGVEDTFAFVRLDMDLYDPIYAGLEFFYPKMARGGYMVVHDCRSENFDGARKALIDFCRKYHLGYMCMPDDLGSAVINIGF